MKNTLLILLIIGSLSVQAQIHSTQKGYAKFDAKSTFTSYDGESNELSGEINLNTNEIQFSLPVKSIKTGVKGRDKDMYELLEVEKYPNIKFEGKLTTDFDPFGGKQEATAEGILTIAEVTRDITVTGSLEKTADGLRVEAGWKLLLSDYNIERPSIFFNKVKDEHKIHVSAMLK